MAGIQKAQWEYPVGAMIKGGSGEKNQNKTAMEEGWGKDLLESS